MLTVDSLIEIVKLNDFSVRIATHDLGDDIARRRSRGDAGPSIAWNIGHALHHRAALARVSGCEGPAIDVERFGRDAATDGRDYPTVSEFRAVWHDLSSRLVPAMRRLTPEELRQPSPVPVPHGEQMVGDALVFYTWHEALHVGHINLLRSHFGLTPTATIVRIGAAAAI